MANDHEPIRWVNARGAYSGVTHTRFENGRKITERLPQRGHVGEWGSHNPMRGIRDVRVVRHDGHVVNAVLTNGAAHNDDSTEWAQSQRAKIRYFGWYPIGACPLALLLTGNLKRSNFVDQSLLGDKPCEHGTYSESKPCKHALAEERARKALNVENQNEIIRNYKDTGEKTLEATREQTAALVQAITNALGPQHTPVDETPRTKGSKAP